MIAVVEAAVSGCVDHGGEEELEPKLLSQRTGGASHPASSNVDLCAASGYGLKDEEPGMKDVHPPPNVALDVLKKALSGRVSCRKAGYRAAAR